MNTCIRVAGLLALPLALVAHQAQAATTTLQGPTGSLSVSSYDRTEPFNQGMMWASGVTSMFPSARTEAGALVIEFPKPPGGVDGPYIAAQDTVGSFTALPTNQSMYQLKYNESVFVPLSWSQGANQSNYSIAIDATLISDPGSYGFSAAQQGLAAPTFSFNAGVKGTLADGSTSALMTFDKSVATASTQNITLSALIPAGADVSKLTFDFGVNFLAESSLSGRIANTATHSGQFIVNSIRIQPLSAVPEASTYAMMLLGLGGLACARAARRKA